MHVKSFPNIIINFSSDKFSDGKKKHKNKVTTTLSRDLIKD